jgi:hypothetical protein
MSAVPRQILSDQMRLLAFRATSAGPAIHWRAYLAYGLVVTWLAGIGRYWDNPRASLWQHAGLGSVAYVLVLALLLWVLMLPLRPQRWSYRNVLVFVTLTSLPALLYAIPVERFMTLPAAQQANIWFLAVVASWRVALLLVFLRRVAALSWAAVVVAGLLPLTLIVTALWMLNLEHVVFDLMGGLQPSQESSADGAYAVLTVITLVSVIAFPLLLLAYLALALTYWLGRPLDSEGRRLR